MAALVPAHRVLLYGIVFGAGAFAAIPSGARVVVSSAQTATMGAPLPEQTRHASEALLRLVDWGRFCDWHSRHHLCRELNATRLSCQQQPDDPSCADGDDDQFCEERPDHPLCGDDRFCDKRPDHPLCDEEPPPSPS